MKYKFIITETNLDHICRQLKLASVGDVVRVSPPDKSRDQEEKYHAMLNDISKVCEFMGKKRDAETWKRLLVDAFAKIKDAEGEPLSGHGEVIPSLDGSSVVQLGFQTRRFTIAQASEFIEHLYAFGAQHNVKFRTKVINENSLHTESNS